MAQIAIEKAYELKAIGGQQVYDDLDRIAKKFKEISDIKRALNLQMGDVKETQEYKDLAEKLRKVQVEYKALQKEMERLQLKVKELEAFNKQADAAAKRASADKIATAKAATEAAKQATEAAKQATQQSIKDINAERQAAAAAAKDLKQLQLARAQARNQAPAAAPGSYNDIAAQYKTTLANYKGTVNLQDAAALTAAQQHLMSLKNQLDAFNRSLTQDKVLIGEYTTGVMNAFKRMGLGHLITDQVNTAKASLQTLNTEFQQIKIQLDAIRQAGVGDLQAVERMLVENRQAAMQLETELGRVQTELRGIGNVGTQITRAIGNEFKNLKQHFISFVVGYLGFQQLISGLHSAVRVNYDLSDSFSDIQNRIHGTEEEVQSLVASLKQLDTRSSLGSLVDITAILSKKGVARDEIAGVAKSIDDLMVALGKEMGDPKETISSLVKLVTVYSEDKHVTADNINAIGGAIAKLSTSGVATGRFLVDFAERMAGIRGITGITIDKVLGLGAALEEIGQRTEVSSTALSQIIIKLFTDSQKYADILEETLGQFQSRLKEDVLGTFVLVAEKLKGNAGEMEAFFSNAVDMHLRGARAISVIGDIAGNVEYAKKRMQDATKAMHEHGLVADMAATKQHNFAASIDRVKKSFELAYNTNGVVVTLELFAKAIVGLIALLPTLIKLGALLLTGWIAQNTQLVLLRGQLIAYTAATWAYNAAMGVVSIAQTAYAVGLGVLTGAMRIATGATVMMNAAMAASPIGGFILLLGSLAAVAGLLTAGVVYATRSIQGNSAALKDNSRELLQRQLVAHKANDQIAETINKIKTYTNVLKDNTAGQEMHKRALDDLIAISPDYLGQLTEQNFKTKEGTEILDKYITKLKAKAEYEAASAIQTEKAKKDLELQSIEYSLLQKKAAGKTDVNDMTEDEKSMLGNLSRNLPTFSGLTGLRGGYYGKMLSGITFVDEALQGVRDARAALAKEMEITEKLVEEKYKGKGGHGVVVMGQTFTNAAQRKMIEEQINQVKLARAHYDQGTKEYTKYNTEIGDLLGKWVEAGGREPNVIGAEIERVKNELKVTKNESLKGSLRAQRKALYAELEKAWELWEGETGHARKGSRVETEDQENIKRINADRDRRLTALRTAYMEQDATRKFYNKRQIDDERVFQEELQKIEEYAIRRKINTIHGNNPAEQQAREKLNLELLESKKKYADKFYKDDADKLKASLTDKETDAKSQMELVTENPSSTEAEKALAKSGYYRELIGFYKEYMSDMDGLEKKYNEQSKRNAAERNRIAHDYKLKKKRTLEESRQAYIAEQYKESEQDFKAEARKILEAKIKATKDVIADPSTNTGHKREAMEELGRNSDISLLDADDARIQRDIDSTEFLYQNKYLIEKEYLDKRDALQEQFLTNEMRRFEIESETQRRNQEQMTQAAMGGIQVAETIGNGLLQAAMQREAVQERRKDREMAWNKQVLDAQAQSLREKDAIERSMMLAQEQREKQRAESQKRRALLAMGIEYAAAALKIVAANIWQGPTGWAKAAVEEGILAATYAAKIGIAAGTPAYEAGGEVPSDGGQFGGRSHSSGGTSFMFRGREFEAEANELAIINKRSAQSNAVLTLTGTPKQIASGLNAYGGGRDFAPGWSKPVAKFDRGAGWMAESAQVPQFISAHYARKHAAEAGISSANQAQDARNAEIYETVMATSASVMALTSHVHKIQVGIDPYGLNDYNNRNNKAVRVSKMI